MGNHDTDQYRSGSDHIEWTVDVNADYYYKKTTDMLLSVAIPSFTGYSAPDRNVGKMHTRGWEVKLGWSDRIGDVSYAVSFNISDYKSIIDNLNGKQQFNSDGTIITEGAEYNSWYGYKTAGLFQTAEEVSESALLSASTKPGDVKYVDVSVRTALLTELSMRHTTV